MKLRVGDNIKVTAGKDRGRAGKIQKLYPKESKVLVEGVNKYKKHLKPQGERRPGGIIDMDRPLPVANVVLICPACKQQTRIGFKIDADGGKSRTCRKCKATV